MAKYVRLKDGTICDDVDNYIIDEEGNYCEIVSRWGKNEEVIMIPKDCIEKESDNLDDLFDEYVLFDKNFNTYGVFDKKVINYKWLKNNKTIYPSEWCIIYGAIWTNKGLIFVAKMNEDGEWELI